MLFTITKRVSLPENNNTYDFDVIALVSEAYNVRMTDYWVRGIYDTSVINVIRTHDFSCFGKGAKKYSMIINRVIDLFEYDQNMYGQKLSVIDGGKCNE